MHDHQPSATHLVLKTPRCRAPDRWALSRFHSLTVLAFGPAWLRSLLLFLGQEHDESLLLLLGQEHDDDDDDDVPRSCGRTP